MVCLSSYIELITMLYTYLGKRNDINPELVTGRLYELVIQERPAGRAPNGGQLTMPTIVSPFLIPYASWRSFDRNWIPFVDTRQARYEQTLKEIEDAYHEVIKIIDSSFEYNSLNKRHFERPFKEWFAKKMDYKLMGSK